MQEYTRTIRELINNPRRQHRLLKNKPLWLQLCSSLDVIEDTELAIASYEAGESRTSDGSRYLAVYGLLQALFVQQDAVFNLCESLGIPESLGNYPRLEEIREVRHDSVGHPTKRARKRGHPTSYHFISRATLRPDGFDLLSQYSDGELKRTTVSITGLVADQRRYVDDVLQAVIRTLEEEEAAHKEKFRVQKLAAVFPSTLDYALQKVLQCTTTTEDAALGQAHLQEIAQALQAFRDALARRGIELDTYPSIRDVYQSLEYPLGQLEKFFERAKAGAGPRIDARAAEIFAWYVQRQVAELRAMAREIDADYSS
jgi:hypothetical protein